MALWGTAGSVLIVLIMMLPAVRRQWREDRAGAIRTLGVASGYVAGTVALVLLLLLSGKLGDDVATRLCLGLLALYLVYGAIWLIRLVPNYRKSVPAWMQPRPDYLDLVFGIPTAVVLAAVLYRYGAILLGLS